MLGRVKGTSKLLPTDRDKAAAEAPASQTAGKAPAPRKKVRKSRIRRCDSCDS